MTSQSELEKISQTLARYFDGLYHADREMLRQVFHPDARYINTVEGDYMNYSMTEYFSIVNQRTPPASTATLRKDRILSVEIGNERMAFVKLSMSMMGRDYLDFLTLLSDGTQWRIVTKVFSYTEQR